MASLSKYIYISSQEDTIKKHRSSEKDGILQYIKTEFPGFLSNNSNTCFMIPPNFSPLEQKREYKDDAEMYSSEPRSICSYWSNHIESRSQGDKAKEEIYEKLKAMEISAVIFYDRPFINKRGEGIGKDCDFVILTKDKKLCLLEVKCCADKPDKHVRKISNKSAIKDNRRSAVNKINRHIISLYDAFGIPPASVGQVLAWPFLRQYNDDGKERFTQAKQTDVKHMFKEQCREENIFSSFLSEYFEKLPSLELPIWVDILKHFTQLGCGAVLDRLNIRFDKHLTLLSREQLTLMYSLNQTTDDPLLIYGPPGSGKTFLMVTKICQLWEDKRIGEDNKCLVLSSPGSFGVRFLIKKLLAKKGIDQVNIMHIPHPQNKFQAWCKQNAETFTHIFVDAPEEVAGCCNVSRNVKDLQTTRTHNLKGHFWIMVDAKRAMYKSEDISVVSEACLRLTRSYRSTASIVEFICELEKRNIPSGEKTGTVSDCSLIKRPRQSVSMPICSLVSNSTGPSVYIFDQKNDESLDENICKLIKGLCRLKCVAPNDLVLLIPDDNPEGIFDIATVNRRLKELDSSVYSAPEGILGAVHFLELYQKNTFCVASISEYKGLESKVVVGFPIQPKRSSNLSMEKMIYQMASRCCFLLVLVLNESEATDVIDSTHAKKWRTLDFTPNASHTCTCDLLQD